MISLCFDPRRVIFQWGGDFLFIGTHFQTFRNSLCVTCTSLCTSHMHEAVCSLEFYQAAWHATQSTHHTFTNSWPLLNYLQLHVVQLIAYITYLPLAEPSYFFFFFHLLSHFLSPKCLRQLYLKKSLDKNL